MLRRVFPRKSSSGIRHGINSDAQSSLADFRPLHSLWAPSAISGCSPFRGWAYVTLNRNRCASPSASLAPKVAVLVGKVRPRLSRQIAKRSPLRTISVCQHHGRHHASLDITTRRSVSYSEIAGCAQRLRALTVRSGGWFPAPPNAVLRPA